MTKRKKNTRERRALVGALCTAAVIVAGSTFAWFTSQDEVTNRLSASAEYGVAIAESFQPLETWVPGQEINKDASAVNTGNVDAFVRMYLDGNMRLLQQNKAATTTAQWNATDAFGTALTNVATVTDSNISSMGLTEYKSVTASGTTTTYYFKTLDKTQTINPGTNASTNAYGYGADSDSGLSGPYSEVQAMQSSRLAYAPTGASYAFVLKEETKLPNVLVAEDGEGAGSVEVTVPAGTLVIVNASDTEESTITDGVFAPYDTNITITSASGAEYTSSSTVYVTADLPILTNVEYESFTPFTDGLYLFLRNDDEALVSDPEFSGYYVTGLTANDMDSSDGTYYALNTNTGTTSNRSDYTVKGAATATKDAPVQVTIVDGVIKTVTPTTNLELYTASYAEFDADALDWYTNDDKDTVYAVYNKTKLTSGTAQDEFDKDNDIVIIISLANVGTYDEDDEDTIEMWSPIGGTTISSIFKQYALGDSTSFTTDASSLKFYYNNDVEAGDSTAKLVDKVTLYGGVTNKAYLAFDFDLNVHLDSVQVTFDETGKELDTAVAASKGEEWKGTAVNDGGATGSATNTGNEITSITWTAAPTA